MTTYQTAPRYICRMVRQGTARYIGEPCGSAHAVAGLASALLDAEPSEVMLAIYLGGTNQVLGVEVVSRGGISGTAVHPRDLLRGAMLLNASALVVCHNHPSGDPTPSDADLSFTRALIRACEVVGIPLLDHLVVSRGKPFVSMLDKFSELWRQS